ncbi:MAG: 4-hydroxybenzoyl-CoA thioesterase [Gammaproteobacteria bacterium]|jgi:4-hydroxybenzoyl-CoA thioesterase
MMMYWRELTVNWGESDPFGLVYYPRMLSWFNDTEHELFRRIGYPIDAMIANNRTTFVMGEVHFRFIGPAAYGDSVLSIIKLQKMGASTLHWKTRCVNAVSGAPVCEGLGTRVYARINEDGSLASAVIPDDMRQALSSFDEFENLKPVDFESAFDL